MGLSVIDGAWPSEVGQNMTAGNVLDLLIERSGVRSVPAHIRLDNGPEPIIQAIRSPRTKAKLDAFMGPPKNMSRKP